MLLAFSSQTEIMVHFPIILTAPSMTVESPLTKQEKLAQLANTMFSDNRFSLFVTLFRGNCTTDLPNDTGNRSLSV